LGPDRSGGDDEPSVCRCVAAVSRFVASGSVGRAWCPDTHHDDAMPLALATNVDSSFVVAATLTTMTS
jgi:hypothetical protein